MRRREVGSLTGTLHSHHSGTSERESKRRQGQVGRRCVHLLCVLGVGSVDESGHTPRVPRVGVSGTGRGATVGETIWSVHPVATGQTGLQGTVIGT